MKYCLAYPVELDFAEPTELKVLFESARGGRESRVKWGHFPRSWGGPHENLKFFRNFFSSKIFKNDVYGSRKYLEIILGINLEQPKGTN